jgi:hypothetical protein
MSTTLEPMLDNDVPVDEQGPAALPDGEVVLQVDAVDVFELWRHLREACFKSGIMISEQPDFGNFPDRHSDIAQSFLTDFQFFLDGWTTLPSYGRVATDGTPVDSVSITYDDLRAQIFAELYKRAMGR